MSELKAKFGADAVRLRSETVETPEFDHCLCKLDMAWLCRHAGLDARDRGERVIQLKKTTKFIVTPVKRVNNPDALVLA